MARKSEKTAPESKRLFGLFRKRHVKREEAFRRLLINAGKAIGATALGQPDPMRTIAINTAFMQVIASVRDNFDKNWLEADSTAVRMIKGAATAESPEEWTALKDEADYVEGQIQNTLDNEDVMFITMCYFFAPEKARRRMQSLGMV